MKTEAARKYAAERGIAEEGAPCMAATSKEFVEIGAEAYAKV